MFLISGFKIQNSFVSFFLFFFFLQKEGHRHVTMGLIKVILLNFSRKDPVLLWPYEELKRVKLNNISNNQIYNLRVI